MRITFNPLRRLSVALVFGALWLCAHTAHGAQVSGVNVPDSVTVNGQTLVLNGAGLRARFVFDVYVAALYTSAATTDANTIIQDAQPRVMTLTLLRNIDADQLLSALKTGLRDNHDNAALAALEPATQTLETIVNRVGKAQKGDVITVKLDADGVTLDLNDRELGRIADARMGPAMLRIWLGERPAQDSLKRALLGG